MSSDKRVTTAVIFNPRVRWISDAQRRGQNENLAIPGTAEILFGPYFGAQQDSPTSPPLSVSLEPNASTICSLYEARQSDKLQLQARNSTIARRGAKQTPTRCRSTRIAALHRSARDKLLADSRRRSNLIPPAEHLRAVVSGSKRRYAYNGRQREHKLVNLRHFFYGCGTRDQYAWHRYIHHCASQWPCGTGRSVCKCDDL